MFIKIVLALALAVFATGVQAQPGEDISKKKGPQVVEIDQGNKKVAVLLPSETFKQPTEAENFRLLAKELLAACRKNKGGCSKEEFLESLRVSDPRVTGVVMK